MERITSWYDYYRDRVCKEYFDYFKIRYARFIEEIEKEIVDGHIIAEYGCGTCNVTRILFEKHKTFCSYWGIDYSYQMLELSKLNLQNVFPHNVDLIEMDIRYPLGLRGHISHGHGVLEHFGDFDIRRIINNQKLSFDKIIHYVPSNKYSHKSFGDERLMSPHAWEVISKPDKIIEFNDGYDLILKWEGKRWEGSPDDIDNINTNKGECHD